MFLYRPDGQGARLGLEAGVRARVGNVTRKSWMKSAYHVLLAAPDVPPLARPRLSKI